MMSMKTFVKPRIVSSKCIEFEFCRFNGQIIRSDFVSQLKPFVEFLPVCAEVEIGLGIPRDPIRIVHDKTGKHLVQPSTGKDVTDAMDQFSNRFLDSLVDVDGFILKSQSPSCGLRDVKIFPAEKNVAPIMRSSGFFGQRVLQRFPLLAIEDEMRLKNSIIREHFLRKIFTFAAFRSTRKTQSIPQLIQFHSENKFLFMSYSQKHLKEMGKLVANQASYPTNDLFSMYEQQLSELFAKAPRCTSNINVLHHMMGYVSAKISKDEKQFFLSLLEQFRQGKIPISAPVNLMRSWVIRTQQPYLLPQTFFQPYPDELLDAEALTSCGLRDFWK
jgi:uncharacterized protein YbgA (DUF1722 family)/uncharacterized protein YbbK (DUF523 family)